jgi:hypothetical protein
MHTHTQPQHAHTHTHTCNRSTHVTRRTCEGHARARARRLVHLPVHERALALCTLVPELDHTLRGVCLCVCVWVGVGGGATATTARGCLFSSICSCLYLICFHGGGHMQADRQWPLALCTHAWRRPDAGRQAVAVGDVQARTRARKQVSPVARRRPANSAQAPSVLAQSGQAHATHTHTHTHTHTRTHARTHTHTHTHARTHARTHAHTHTYTHTHLSYHTSDVTLTRTDSIISR